MFTSLRSRLWLSYALVITIALSVVLLVLLIFLIRNPFLNRQVQEQLRTAQSLITTAPRQYVDDPEALRQMSQAHHVRLLIFNSARQLVFDTEPDAPSLPFPRRTVLARNAQTARDENGGFWLYTFRRLSGDRILMVAAPRPTVPVLNIFTDELLLPILQGGLLALLLSLALAFGLSRWVADPLQQIVHVAKNYPAQEIIPVPARGPQEVQDLTQAFNSMVERVRSSQKSQRDFVANVSHELKTPLTSIQGFAQAILDGTADTPEARTQAAQIIYKEAGRLHHMAVDLLDLARLEAGTADLNRSPVDISLLLQNIVDKFTPQAQRAGVRLQTKLPEHVPTWTGDGDRLAQVFTNLIDNALKFTPAGGQITMTAAQAENGLDISIMDTGIGIPGDALPHLFERFYQVDPARAGGEQHGAGLGLAIAQEIVQSHGGKINVRSEVGHGTIFVVHLPLATYRVPLK